jgi:uncharacterized protein
MRSPRKIALVTGASGGLGLEFAKLLAADGYDLRLVARSQNRLGEIAADLSREHGVDALPVALDLARPDSADALAMEVPRCDVLINNAGFGTRGRFDQMDEQRIEQEIVLDVLTLTRLTRKYLPAMVAREDGKILNVASTAGFLPGPFMAVYYASKAYVISFSAALAEEVRNSGVTVTCFCPGATRTGFADRAGSRETLLFRLLPLSDAKAMARAGYRAMQRGTLVAVPAPPVNWFVDLSARVTPRRLLLWFSRKAVEVEGG